MRMLCMMTLDPSLYIPVPADPEEAAALAEELAMDMEAEAAFRRLAPKRIPGLWSPGTR
ncbi:MAG: hypothetical protein JNG85_08415 [Spirochaetaceae bacterium]|nr:hypothetical protein [Spirochaetaceae bacterium]